MTRAAPWLFSMRVDLGVFLGSALFSFALLALGASFGLLHRDTPEWTWVVGVLLADVAHVHLTLFRVYLDPLERRRRPWLYGLVPVLAYVGCAALFRLGSDVFWRALAYVAAWHFVRQQYGWVMLYRARAGETDTFGRWFDTAVIHAATLYPLIHWHTRLPRAFAWFVQGDFVALPGVVERVAWPVYVALMAGYALRSAYGYLVTRRVNPGKDVVVGTTVACWYVGIVALDSDYAFTVTNVFIHAVPYAAIVYGYGRRRMAAGERVFRSFAQGPWVMLATVWAIAYVEELLWDRGVWHERAWLFGEGWDADAWRAWLVPLLAVPQVSHYALDGFVWRRRTNPEVVGMIYTRSSSSDASLR